MKIIDLTAILRSYRGMMIRAFILCFVFLLIILPVAAVAMETTAKQAYAFDMETGQVLFEKNGDMRMPTSSMSKVMSMYVVFEALKDGRLKLEDTIEISEKAWRKGGSKMFVEVGEEVKVEDLIRGVIIQSGNDATIALAEALSGSEDAFAERLNSKAQELGMENTNLVNASGWPDENHYSTAQDLGILARHLIEKFPEYYKYYAETEFEFNNIKQSNRNPLLYRNIGADGVKTGHTDAGGYGVIGSGVRDGRRVILVLNGMEDARERARESAKILDWALREFENKMVFEAGQDIEKAPVLMGKEKEVTLVLKENILMTLPKSTEDNVKTQIILDGQIVAPVSQGQKLGVLSIELPNDQTLTADLFAGQGVEKLGFFARSFEKMRLAIKDMIGNL